MPGASSGPAPLEARSLSVAFDVDDTLIDEDGNPRNPIIGLLLTLFQYTEADIVVWSSRGRDYAAHWVDRLGLNNFVHEIRGKDSDYQPDIAFDDDVSEAGLASCLVVVKPDGESRTNGV